MGICYVPGTGLGSGDTAGHWTAWGPALTELAPASGPLCAPVSASSPSVSGRPVPSAEAFGSRRPGAAAVLGVGCALLSCSRRAACRPTRRVVGARRALHTASLQSAVPASRVGRKGSGWHRESHQCSRDNGRSSKQISIIQLFHTVLPLK